MTKQSPDTADRPPTFAEAVSNYLSSLAPEARRRAGPELSRFARWYGGGRSLRSATPADVERYLQQPGPARNTDQVEPLKEFLADLQRRGLVDVPLAAAIRIRRKATAKPSGGEAPRPAVAGRASTNAGDDRSSGDVRCASCGEAEHLRGT